MARGPFPTGQIGRGLSAAPIGAAVSPRGGAGAALARSTEALAERVQGLVDRAEARAGMAEAAADAEGGAVALRGGLGVRDMAYDRVAREHLSASQRTAYLDGLQRIEIQYPDDPAGFAEAEAAHRAAFRQSAVDDPALRLDLEQFATIQSAAALGRVRQGAERRRIDTGRAALLGDLEVETRALGQTVAGAGFDEAGAAQVATGFGRFAERLARFGPREGFTIGGIEFGPDETRLEVADAETLARMALQAHGEARSSWILNAAQNLPDAASKAAFADEVRQRWAAGDAMFAGLDASMMDALNARLRGEADRTAQDERAERAQAGQHARNLIEALRYGGSVDPAELRQVAAASGDPGLVAQADWALTVGMTPPGGSGGGGIYAGDVSAAGGFDAWAGFFIQWETGGGATPQVIDSNGTVSRWGINQAANPDLDVSNLSRAAATARLRSHYWNAIGGDRLPPALAFVAADAAAVAGPERANGWISESGGDVGRFTALQEAHYRRLATENPERFGQYLEGWLNRLDDARSAAARIQSFANARDGMASDPLAYALGSENRPALASVPSLQLDGWKTAETAGAWGDALRRRRALGLQLAEQYQVAPRMLTDGEAAAYREAIDADPAVAIGLARRAMAATDEQGARELLREIGGDGPSPLVALHLADLEVGGSRNFVAQVIQGMELRQDGQRQRDYEPGEETIDQALARFAPALANQSGVLPAARQVAELARLADSARGAVRTSESYLQSALGATTRGGRIYGGLATVNGRPTILPRWLEAEEARPALGEVLALLEERGVGPVWSNGDPVRERDAGRIQLELMEDGRYGLRDRRHGRWVAARDGAPFRLDLEQARDYLALRLPGSVLPARRR